jgi:hypothetical protein
MVLALCKKALGKHKTGATLARDRIFARTKVFLIENLFPPVAD